MLCVSGSSVIDFKEKIVNETIKWFSDKLNTIRVREDLLLAQRVILLSVQSILNIPPVV